MIAWYELILIVEGQICHNPEPQPIVIVFSQHKTADRDVILIWIIIQSALYLKVNYLERLFEMRLRDIELFIDESANYGIKLWKSIDECFEPSCT